MVDRIDMQVIRNNQYQLRRQSVPINSSIGLIQVVKLPRYRHQSLNCQNTYQSEKLNVQCVTITRQILPQSIKLANVDESLQSVSILMLDASRRDELKLPPPPPPSISNHSIKPSIKFVKRNDSHRSLKLQIKRNYQLNSNRNSDNKESTITYHKYKNKTKGLFNHCCSCSPLCKFLSIIAFIILATIIAAIVTALLSSKKITTALVTITTQTTVSTSTTTSVSTTTTTVTTTTETTVTTTILCSPSCTSQQTCINGICLNVGHLAITLTWSRQGDGDIVVTTPNNRIIYYQNKGPLNTDGGLLDRDDQHNTGPENVYWPTSGSLPPTGTYYICFEPYSIAPNISNIDPITVIYQIMRPPSSLIVFTRTFISVLKNSYNCDSTSSTLVGSFTYP